MRPIQITIDEQLLGRLDADDETKRDGRSAVVRRAVQEYLRRRRRAGIAAAYRRGYGGHPAADFAEWVGQGAWPEE